MGLSETFFRGKDRLFTQSSSPLIFSPGRSSLPFSLTERSSTGICLNQHVEERDVDGRPPLPVFQLLRGGRPRRCREKQEQRRNACQASENTPHVWNPPLPFKYCWRLSAGKGSVG